MMNQPTIQKKVCLLGDFAVGKTSLVRRYVYDLFDDKYLSSIGVRVSRKELLVPRPSGPAALSLMLWDLAGSREFTQMQVSYLRGSAGAILVWDLTRPESLAGLESYLDNLRRISPDARLILAGNKRDLVAGPALPASAAALAQAFAAPVYLTSAKTGEGVEALFAQLGELLLA